MSLGFYVDVQRCIGCRTCQVACKDRHNLQAAGPRTRRVGSFECGTYPEVGMFHLTVSCNHCDDPACTKVCPTGASHKAADGTVQIDKSKCIGCQFCAMSCPYGVRYLNEEERVVEKCTLCEQKIAQGELPQCVSQCCGMARWFGDADEGIEGFVGPRGEILGEYISPFSDDQVYSLPDVGNKPSLRYILRDMKWQGGGE